MDHPGEPANRIVPATDPVRRARGPWQRLARRGRWAVGAGVAVGILGGAAAVMWGRLADRPATDLALPAPSVLAVTTPDLDLATSTQAAPGHEPGSVTVLVTRRQLVIGGDPRPVATFPEGLGAAGLPAIYKRGGPNDLYLSELGNGLTFWRGAAAEEADAGPVALAVVADASTPYRVLVEVLFTAGQVGFDRYDLAVRAPGGGVGWLVSTPPRMSRGLSAVRPRLGLGATVLVVDAGFAIKARAGNVAPGCAGVGAGVAVPKIAGAHDGPGLTACLRKIKDSVPEAKDETRITLVANPSIDLQTIALTMDALQGTPGSGPLFPDVSFGVASTGLVPSAHESVPGADAVRDLDTLGAPPGVDAGTGPEVRVAVAVGAQAGPVVSGMASAFRRCYKKGLAEDPNMKGSVKITAKIGPKGEVLSVSPSGTGLSGLVVTCVAARVSIARFAPPEGGSATVVIPVTFVLQ